ncbi:2-oxoglutarate dehydrogenase complex E2 component [Orbilia oligospora]|uniref:dihydrolipoyllysine-residue succinyltransferase n=1 Tax=Orbilia oligospora TaxID=2813651 RepID=A0A7C8K0Q8_ORBOL|nr:2-oxoglutarate dehydrogenase complex E2 component [Orbilia oligospora]KAF3168471.1 2-oxoglutarate dehydrogenase complex E2 component [Orbilia oligospora]KAF3235994.1 2-oxoglutarate dehydrogenase complex E2 component [Orbilia oligospora]KAF3248033.1 2-oxoglutarate dehydrogenase complex E2 component [Orbilia oligospora]KAF3279251.1 2-oxoglutarate dehydrogenase complex E2 component [Orbilia oligospora]
MPSFSALRSTALRLNHPSLFSHLQTSSCRLFHVKAPITGLIAKQTPRSSHAAASYPLLSLHQWRSYADSVTIKVPPMAESISEGTLKQWLKEVGEQVEQDEEIATIETDKIDVAVNAPQAGILKELLVEADTTVTVGQDLARLEPGEGAPKPAKEETKKEEPAPSPPPKKTEESKPAEKAPQPKKVAEKPKAETSPPPTTHSAPAADGIGNRGEQRVKMNRMRLRTGERLKQSQNTAASLTTFNEVDMSAVMEMRSLYKNVVLEKTGVKLGFVSFFTKACILAMKDVPVVNASIEGPNGGDTIVYRDYVDVSIAVATEKGLVTPVIRNAETLDLVGIDKAISELGEKARHGKITLEDLAGGTFTISNGGVFGSLMGTPIINLPQSAVLGLHATKQRPVVVNGKIEIRPMMYLALTYDHRLLDGREAVTFLVKVKEYIEDPRRMLLP